MLIMEDKQGNKIVEVFDGRYDAHAHHVALNLREDDFNEVFASDGTSPKNGLFESWRLSLRRWAILNKDDEAVAVLGVTPAETFSDIGIPWLLGTDGLNKMKKFFVKISKGIIEEMKCNFKILINFVDERYIKAVRWLEWCGFTINKSKPYGALKLPFHEFYMELT